MAGNTIRAFFGLTPAVSKQAMSNESAQVADNARLEGGDLQSWNAPLQILALTSLNPVTSIYRYGIASSSETQFWFQFDTDVDVVKGPVAGDVEERTYWTGDGAYPKKTRSDIATTGAPYPTSHYRLGVPAPAVAPTVAVTGSVPGPDDPLQTAVWGYTYVTTWDEEGPMSPLSASATWGPAQTPQLSAMSVAPAGPYTVNRKRIYRSNSGTNSTDLQFVAEIAVATTSFSDTVASSALGAVSATRFWNPPPDSLKGLCEVSNEMLAGFFDNTVAFCEPGVPYAWPTRYYYSFDSPVIGIKAFDNSLVVCCKRGTYLMTGADPSMMSQTPVTDAGVCLSKRGMVQMLGGVLYPVKQGLQFVGPGGAKVITDPAFDENTWNAYAPTSFTAVGWNNRYIAFFDTGAKQGSLVISLGTTPANITETTVFATAAFVEGSTGLLYVVQSNNIRRWDGGTVLTYKWRSKTWRYDKPISMARAKLEADSYPMTLRWYANGVLRHTETVADQYAFTITDGDVHIYGEVEIEGTARVTAFSIATSMDELKKL